MEGEQVRSGIQLSRRALIKLPDSLIEKAGEMLVHALKRERDLMLCEKNGHVKEERFAIVGICDRCSEVIDEERYEHAKHPEPVN